MINLVEYLRRESQTLSDSKKPNYLVLLLVAGAVYWFATKRATDVTPTPTPAPSQISEVVKSVFPTMRTEFRRVFEESATKVESGEITNDAQLFDFVQPATKAARESANKPFDTQLDLSLPRNDDGSFTGKEKEAAALLRRIAQSW